LLPRVLPLTRPVAAPVPTSLALAHQGMALILLLALVWNVSVLRSREQR